MSEMRFLVKGSQSDPYEVVFRKIGTSFSAWCTCTAGQNGQYCKHRFAIMDGLSKGVVSENSDEVMIVESWVPGTDVGRIWDELKSAETELAEMKRRVSSLKKGLAKAMRTS